MTHAIQNSNASHYAPQQSSMENAGHMSYRETMAQTSQSEITITTDQGDVVTISNFQGESQSMSYDRWNSPLQQGMNFSTSMIQGDSFSLSIQGDLNEEELLDIGFLLDDLSLIAGDFFNGDLDQAMAGALNIGDMGSLAELSATFSYSASWSANQLTQNHPIPASGAFEDLLGDVMNDLPETTVSQENPEIEYAKSLQAQWQQIKGIFEEREAILPPKAEQATIASSKRISAAQKMMHKMEKMMTKHPRLSPFALPLAHEAIDSQADKLQHKGFSGQKNQLKENFLQELNNWMNAE